MLRGMDMSKEMKTIEEIHENSDFMVLIREKKLETPAEETAAPAENDSASLKETKS